MRYQAIGPFYFSIFSDCPAVMRDLELIYSDYPSPRLGRIIDYPVSVKTARGLRRYIRPQANFFLDETMPFKPLAKGQAYAMLEWGMNWCITTSAHQFLILHAGVVEKNGKVIVMPAEQGAGKSTLTAALVFNGWRLFSDELALFSLADSLLYPCTRPINLKNESIDIIGNYIAGAVFSAVAEDTHKGRVALLKPPTESVLRMDEPAALHAVVFPRYVPGSQATLTPVDKLDAFQQLIGHSFNYDILGEEGFKLVVDLLQKVDCYQFEYSDFEQARTVLGRLVS